MPTTKEAKRVAERKRFARPDVYQRHREKQWAQQGITNLDGTPFLYADYQLLFTKQDGQCAICDQSPTGKRPLNVDHDHDTGIARGLLCNPCNVFRVGAIESDKDLFTRTLTYLRQWGAIHTSDN